MKPMRSSAFLSKLRQDASGNTLAMMAIAFIPLVGLIGGGVDMSRMYLVKTRLQQACDAGSLAGRKAMGGGSWTDSNGVSAGSIRANQLFSANFASGAYGTGTLTKSFTEANGIVTGTASVAVPMTLMKVFGFRSTTLSVNCTAKMEIPNTDVMFVLDLTTSMECAPSDPNVFCNTGVSTSSKRITALKEAVKCFYETVARRDIDDVDCGSTPTGGAGTAQIRFGFVPYATNVNVGKLLPNDYLVDIAPYQTRRADLAVPPRKTTNVWQNYSGGSLTQADCQKYLNNQNVGSFTATPLTSGGPAPAPTMVTSFPDTTLTSGTSTGEWGWTSGSDGTWGSWSTASDNSTGGNDNKKSCRRKKTEVTTYYEEKFQNWTYGQFDVDVRGLKNGGSTWNSSFTLPSSTDDDQTESVAEAVTNASDPTPGKDIPASTITWDGCIEERATVQTDDFDPIPDEALDLDINLVPDVTDDDTRWKPALPRLIFTRGSSAGAPYKGSSWSGTNTGSWRTGDLTTTTTSLSNSAFSYSCPTEAKKLRTWASVADAASFKGYVNGLTPNGATYHDIGLLWGARLISPTGIFGSENAMTANGGAIERHLIFMTDGFTNANDYDYTAYGLPFYDHRQTDAGPSKDDLDEQVNSRFSAICQAVKNMNITLWVVSFGAGVDQTTKDRLTTCATDEDHFFDSEDSDDLIDDFKEIANEIADLRLTS